MGFKSDSAEFLETAEKMQYHIRIKPGDLPDIVLMPGDPKRLKKITKGWDISEEIADYRQYVTYKGEYKGAPIAAISSGIGPSAVEIAVAELKNVGIKHIIRVGSCGVLDPEINIGDIVISEAAVRLEENNLPYHVGITATSSSFYVGQGRPGFDDYMPSHRVNLIEDLIKAGVTNIEMEASLLFILGSLYKIHTGVVCAVYANRATDKFGTKGELKAIIAANEAVKIIYDWYQDDEAKFYL